MGDSRLVGLENVLMGSKDVLPIVEGGKGIGATSGATAGAFAKSGAVGTISAVNNDYINDNGEYEPVVYRGKTRNERHEELVEYGIKAAVSQAKRASDVRGNSGLVHINMLWEAAGAQRVISGVLERARGLVNGVTCGAGMPYKLAEICSRYFVYYYPIVSSKRAFNALWRRSYHKFRDWIGGVVYECPWKAGGHNGLSNSESPDDPQDPYARIVEIRKYMNEVDLNDVPIILAGGVWRLFDFERYLNNPEVGKIAFQFGTRPLYTVESPIPGAWKEKLFTVQDGEVSLNKFSPTGFYSSAVRNSFLDELHERGARQVAFSRVKVDDYALPVKIGRREVYVSAEDKVSVDRYIGQGFTEPMKTPSGTLIFVTQEKKKNIHINQVNCMGCLTACRFSNWSEHEESHAIGAIPDPRSYCIQKTLQDVFHTKNIENNLMFAGHNVYKFKEDPWYRGGLFMPTIKQLVDRIMTGN